MDSLTLAKQLLHKQEFAKAVKVLLSIKNIGRDVPAMFELGKAYFSLGVYKKAEECFKATYKDRELGSYSKEFLIKIFKAQNSYDKALKIYGSLPNVSASAAFEKAWIYKQLNKTDRALELYERIYKKDKNNIDSCFEAAKILFEQGCLEKAEKYYLQSSKYIRYKEESLSALSEIYHLSGKYQKAKKYFDTLPVGKYVDDAYARRYLIWINSFINENKLKLAKKAVLKMQGLPLSARYANIALNIREMLENKTVLKSLPPRLSVQVTGKCNLNCIMCINSGGEWSLPADKAKELLELMKTAVHIMWSGGEPFVYKGFETLIEKAAKTGIKQMIITNGLLLTDTICQKIAKYNIAVNISIDSFDKKRYERVRRGGDFNVLKRNIKMLAKYRKQYNTTSEFAMSVIVMEDNCSDFLSYIKFAKEYGFRKIFFNPCVGHKYSKYALKCFSKAQKLFNKDNGVEIASWLDNMVTNTIPVNRLKQYSFCRVPWQRMTIMYNGKVKPECSCNGKYCVGTNKPLKKIWNGKLFQKYRKNISKRKYENFCSRSCLDGYFDISERTLLSYSE
jgi:MoaA/NifB/PqqE/SkfB family radical SAM enzyme/thioredoxin-like negative regulator of GroEL